MIPKLHHRANGGVHELLLSFDDNHEPPRRGLWMVLTTTTFLELQSSTMRTTVLTLTRATNLSRHMTPTMSML